LYFVLEFVLCTLFDLLVLHPHHPQSTHFKAETQIGNWQLEIGNAYNPPSHANIREELPIL